MSALGLDTSKEPASAANDLDVPATAVLQLFWLSPWKFPLIGPGPA